MSQDRIVAHGQVYVTATRGAAELGDDVNAALIRDGAHRELAEVAVGAPWYVAQPDLVAGPGAGQQLLGECGAEPHQRRAYS